MSRAEELALDFTQLLDAKHPKDIMFIRERIEDFGRECIAAAAEEACRAVRACESIPAALKEMPLP